MLVGVVFIQHQGHQHGYVCLFGLHCILPTSMISVFSFSATDSVAVAFHFFPGFFFNHSFGYFGCMFLDLFSSLHRSLRAYIFGHSGYAAGTLHRKQQNISALHTFIGSGIQRHNVFGVMSKRYAMPKESRPSAPCSEGFAHRPTCRLCFYRFRQIRLQAGISSSLPSRRQTRRGCCAGYPRG